MGERVSRGVGREADESTRREGTRRTRRRTLLLPVGRHARVTPPACQPVTSLISGAGKVTVEGAGGIVVER